MEQAQSTEEVCVATTLITKQYDVNLQRWMEAWKISFASEAKERSLSKTLVGPNMDGEPVAFTFSSDGGREEVRKAPMAFVPDLVAKVTQLLDQNDQ